MRPSSAVSLLLLVAPAAALLLPGRAPAPRMSSTTKRNTFGNFWRKQTGGGDGSVSFVADFMTRDPSHLEADSTLENAAKELTGRGITGAPVLQDGKLVGVISQKDLLARAAGTRKVPLRTRGPQSERYASNTEAIGKALAGTVAEVMTRSPTTIAPDAKMSDAAALLLRKGINRLLVVDGDSLVGIITTTDVLRLVLDECGTSKECLFE